MNGTNSANLSLQRSLFLTSSHPVYFANLVHHKCRLLVFLRLKKQHRLSFKTDRCKEMSARQEEMSVFFTSSSLVAPPVFAGQKISRLWTSAFLLLSSLCVLSALLLGKCPPSPALESCLAHCTGMCLTQLHTQV